MDFANYVVRKFLPVYIFHREEKIPRDDVIYFEQWESSNDKFISYYIVYAHNGEISTCPMIYSSRFGLFNRGYSNENNPDIAQVTVCYSEETSGPIIKYVYYFAHGSQGSRVITPEFYNNTTRIKVHVALGSHASYPHGDTRVRCFGFANDRIMDVRSGGHLWVPNRIAHATTMPLLAYNSVINSRWYKNIPIEEWYPEWKRYFCVWA